MTDIPDNTEFAEGNDSQFSRVGHRIVFSVLSGGGSALLLAALGAIAIRLITVRVGPAHYGYFVIAMAFVGTVTLFTDLGISAIMGREIAQSPKDGADVLGHNLGLRLVLSGVVVPNDQSFLTANITLGRAREQAVATYLEGFSLRSDSRAGRYPSRQRA